MTKSIQPAPRAPLQLRSIPSLTRAEKLTRLRRMLSTWPSWPWAETAFREVDEPDADGEIIIRYRHNRRQRLPSKMVTCPICQRTMPPNALEYFFPGEGLLGGDVSDLEDDQRRPIGVWACADHKRASIQRAYGRSPSGMSIQAWKAIHAGESRPDVPTINTEDLRDLTTDPPRKLPRESDAALQREIDYANRTGRTSPDATWDAETGKAPTFKRRSRCTKPDNEA